MNSALEISPQMVSGHVVSNDDRQWDLSLRDGLLWHDGERVLARDCVASIRRWAGARRVWRRTDGGDGRIVRRRMNRTIRFRLKRPFPLLPAALASPRSRRPS